MALQRPATWNTIQTYPCPETGASYPQLPPASPESVHAPAVYIHPHKASARPRMPRHIASRSQLKQTPLYDHTQQKRTRPYQTLHHLPNELYVREVLSVRPCQPMDRPMDKLRALPVVKCT